MIFTPSELSVPITQRTLRWLKPATPFIHKLFQTIIDKYCIIILNYYRTDYKEIKMDINVLIQTLQSAVPQIAESYCIVNGALMNLSEVQNMGYDEFSMRAKINIPLKLYKYFPNRPTELIDKQTGKPIKDEITGDIKTINYSIQALRDNTVFMQSPSLFDDVYDSDIGLNYLEYERARLLEYCIRCEIDVNKTMETPELANALMQTIADMINSTGNIDSLFKGVPATENEDLSNRCFLLELKNQLYEGKDLGESLKNAIVSDFNRYLQYLQDSFRADLFCNDSILSVNVGWFLCGLP